MLDSDKSQAKRSLAAKADELSSVNSELDKLRAKLDGARGPGLALRLCTPPHQKLTLNVPSFVFNANAQI